jgi:hypothetical protein
MDKKLMTKVMEAAMPPFPRDADVGSMRFDAVQMQAFAFAAMEALLRSLPSAPQVLTLSAHQLKAALALAWPDGEANPIQGETVVSLRQLKPFVAVDEDGATHDMPAGLYLRYDDMPEEGVLPVGETQALVA